MGFSLNPLDDLASVVHAGEKVVGDGATDFRDAPSASALSRRR
jgi:hypothetical protein